MQPEGLVKLKTRVKALAEFREMRGRVTRKWEREENKEKTICRPRRVYATFADLISAHDARAAADVRCHLVGNCYRFKFIE